MVPEINGNRIGINQITDISQRLRRYKRYLAAPRPFDRYYSVCRKLTMRECKFVNSIPGRFKLKFVFIIACC